MMSKKYHIIIENTNAIAKYNKDTEHHLKNIVPDMSKQELHDEVKMLLGLYAPTSEKIKNKDKFAEALRKDLFYYFCSKAEYELIFSPWVGGDKEKESIKVDIYTQVMNNFDIFLDYVWNSKDA